MIISRSPFRVSFIGGGTDFEDYYKTGYGNVVSTAINQFIYVTLIKKFDGKLFLRYAEKELVSHVDELKHELVRESLKMFGIESGVEIAIISDIPAKGSGLGSSSALAAALIQAIAKYQGKDIFGKKLAEKTCELEIDILKKPIGRQDQYATCFGGFNKIHFDRSFIKVGNLNNRFYKKKIEWLQQSSMLFYLGNGRKSENILTEHIANIKIKRLVLDSLRDSVTDFIIWLNDKNISNKMIGSLINANWELKKKVTPNATNEQIEKNIFQAYEAGAGGAKVCGAGGGGFLLVICEPNKQNQVRTALKDLQELQFEFETEGTKIIYANH